MKTSELFFELPGDLIAQQAARPADQAKLMVFDRSKKTIGHDFFYNLTNHLRKGDVLVFNDSKVLPARLIGKKSTGGKIEALLLKDMGSNKWEAMIKWSAKKGEQKIVFDDGLTATYKKFTEDTFLLEFNRSGGKLLKSIYKIGKIPTPPYIISIVPIADYQTIYAKSLGSAAAPTAGLHFTKNLLNALSKKGVQLEFITLHVGLGTFQPIKTARVEDHQIHSEYFEVSATTLNHLRKAKQTGKRIIAVGTTSCRVLETLGIEINSSKVMRHASNVHSHVSSIKRNTSIFIYPGYKFQVINGLITNFHTPYSSLLALVMAFAGKQLVRNAYRQAIEEKYKFYSLGDGMLFL